MKFKRNPMNVWYAFWRALDRGASRVKVIRWIFGGCWIMVDGQWWQMDITQHTESGRYMNGKVKDTWLSMHESHQSIQQLEDRS